MKRLTPLVLIAVVSAPLAGAPDDAPTPTPTPRSTPTPAASSGAAPAPAASSPEAKAQAMAERERRERDAVPVITHYFEHPDLDAIPETVKTLSATAWVRDWRNYAALCGFLAPLLRAHPELAGPWMDAWDQLPDVDFVALIGAVWISEIDGAFELMTKQMAFLTDDWHTVINGQYAEEPFDIFTEADMEAYQLEMLWGWYAATGDERCLKRVLFFTEDDREDDNLAEIATTSLSCNAAVYPTVKAWCERELAKVTSDPEHALPEAPQLKAILDEAEYVNAHREALKLSDFGVPRD